MPKGCAYLPHEAKYMVLYGWIKTGSDSDRWLPRILRIRTGSNWILRIGLELDGQI